MQNRQGEFTELLVQQNQKRLRDFRNWIFFPGMLFESPRKWWDSGGKREKPHEGVDLLIYRTKGGRIGTLNEGVIIPSLVNGIIVSVEPDFLGESVFVLYEGSKIFAVGHIRLFDGLKEGMEIRRGEPIGLLEERPNKKIPQHLHVSLGSLLSGLQERVSWDIMGQRDLVKLSDPMPYLADEYELIEKRGKRWLR